MPGEEIVDVAARRGPPRPRSGPPAERTKSPGPPSGSPTASPVAARCCSPAPAPAAGWACSRPAECPPTFGTDPETGSGLPSPAARRRSSQLREGAEDREEDGRRQPRSSATGDLLIGHLRQLRDALCSRRPAARRSRARARSSSPAPRAGGPRRTRRRTWSWLSTPARRSSPARPASRPARRPRRCSTP